MKHNQNTDRLENKTPHIESYSQTIRTLLDRHKQRVCISADAIVYAMSVGENHFVDFFDKCVARMQHDKCHGCFAIPLWPTTRQGFPRFILESPLTSRYVFDMWFKHCDSVPSCRRWYNMHLRKENFFPLLRVHKRD